MSGYALEQLHAKQEITERLHDYVERGGGVAQIEDGARFRLHERHHYQRVDGQWTKRMLYP